MENNAILLVEDSFRDKATTWRALKKSNIVNDIVVVHDGVEASEYLFGTGKSDAGDLAALRSLFCWI